MNIEKEYRFHINDDNILKIQQHTEIVHQSTNMVDIVMGLYGFDSLSKLGYICRIRKKNKIIVLECKSLQDNDIWIEQSIKISSIQEGYKFFSLMGLKPYLYINREREERKTNNFKRSFDKWKKEAQNKIKLFKQEKLTEDELYKWMLENK